MRLGLRSCLLVSRIAAAFLAGAAAVSFHRASGQRAEKTEPGISTAGCILLSHVGHIHWDDLGDGIPAFLTIIIMPFTYSGARLAGCWVEFAARAPVLWNWGSAP